MGQKKQVTLFGIGVFLLFLIAACGKGDGASSISVTNPFIGDPIGLEINFLENSPPEEVIKGSFPFEAAVSLVNNGEFDLENTQVLVSLIGIDPADFGVTDPALLENIQPLDDLIAKKKDRGRITDPVEVVITFPTATTSFNYVGLGDDPTFIFRAEACYKYQTKVLSEICVLDNLINVDEDRICEPRETKNVFSSSSPVQVKEFRHDVAAENKIRFSFDIVHVGNGVVFSNAMATPDCESDPRLRRQKENKVRVNVNTGLPQSLNCIGLSGGSNGIVTLNNGIKTVTCTQDLPTSRSDYTKVVEIILGFDYLDFTDTKVSVMSLGGSDSSSGSVVTDPCGDTFCDSPNGETAANCPADCS